MRVSEKILITEEMVINFSELSGDKNPIHLDENYAKSTVFGKRIVHGMLISSFFSKIIAETYPGKGSIYLQQNMNFINPCFIGDEIEVIVELDKLEGHKYFLKTSITCNNKTLIDGNALILKK